MLANACEQGMHCDQITVDEHPLELIVQSRHLLNEASDTRAHTLNAVSDLRVWWSDARREIARVRRWR